MTYPRRSHRHISTSVLISTIVNGGRKGLLWEVSRCHSTYRNIGNDWTIYSVSNTKINYNTKSE